MAHNDLEQRLLHLRRYSYSQRTSFLLATPSSVKTVYLGNNATLKTICQQQNQPSSSQQSRLGRGETQTHRIKTTNGQMDSEWRTTGYRLQSWWHQLQLRSKMQWTLCLHFLSQLYHNFPLFCVKPIMPSYHAKLSSFPWFSKHNWLQAGLMWVRNVSRYAYSRPTYYFTIISIPHWGMTCFLFHN